MKFCIICGIDLDILGGSGKVILKCPRCGFGVTNNFKLQKASYHRDTSYIEEEDLFKNIFQKRVNKILAFRKNGKALEVGCSTGLMLSLLKEKGWDVLGIEISNEAAGMAKKRGIQIIEEKFEDVKLNEKFDVVILNHTLEHLENPPEVIRRIYSFLNKNGILYIDVPNFGGLSAKVLGSRWSLLLPDEHLWHFSLGSLNILLKDLEFKTIFVDRSSGIWDYDNPLLGIFQSLIRLKKRFFMELLTAVPSWIISKLGAGSDLMVIARKM